MSLLKRKMCRLCRVLLFHRRHFYISLCGHIADTPPAEVQGGPTGGQFTEKTDIKDEADPVGMKWGEEPSAPVDPRTAYQNR